MQHHSRCIPQELGDRHTFKKIVNKEQINESILFCLAGNIHISLGEDVYYQLLTKKFDSVLFAKRFS